MHTIEQAAELHAAIAQNAPHPGGLRQTIITAQGWASNQEAHSLTFTSRVAPGDVTGDARSTFTQGFGCVEINITARWGGCHHDGSTRTGTEVSIYVLDRLAGGMAQRTWHTNGAWGADALCAEDTIPLLRSLLGLEPLESIKAREAAERQQADSETADWMKTWGLGS
jgi:hypothetical protein